MHRVDTRSSEGMQWSSKLERSCLPSAATSWAIEISTAIAVVDCSKPAGPAFAWRCLWAADSRWCWLWDQTNRRNEGHGPCEVESAAVTVPVDIDVVCNHTPLHSCGQWTILAVTPRGGVYDCCCGCCFENCCENCYQQTSLSAAATYVWARKEVVSHL